MKDRVGPRSRREFLGAALVAAAGVAMPVREAGAKEGAGDARLWGERRAHTASDGGAVLHAEITSSGLLG